MNKAQILAAGQEKNMITETLTKPEKATLEQVIDAIEHYVFYFADEFSESAKALMLQAVGSLIRPEFKDFWDATVDAWMKE